MINYYLIHSDKKYGHYKKCLLVNVIQTENNIIFIHINFEIWKF